MSHKKHTLIGVVSKTNSDTSIVETLRENYDFKNMEDPCKGLEESQKPEASGIFLDKPSAAILAKELTELRQKLSDIHLRWEQEVSSRTRALELANRRLEELARHDPLTNILNRRAFLNELQEEINRSERYRHPMIVAMIDVDHFKHLNDMEGHVYGDEALKKVAQVISKNIRKTDCLARYGGEEFTILMPETSVREAKEICERLRASIETTAFQGSKGQAYLTISVGLAAYPDHARDSKNLISEADRALYQAKEGGRNRVVIC